MKLMKEKTLYISPEMKVFTVRIQRVICQSGEFGINNWNDPGTDPIDF